MFLHPYHVSATNQRPECWHGDSRITPSSLESYSCRFHGAVVGFVDWRLADACGMIVKSPRRKRPLRLLSSEYRRFDTYVGPIMICITGARRSPRHRSRSICVADQLTDHSGKNLTWFIRRRGGLRPPSPTCRSSPAVMGSLYKLQSVQRASLPYSNRHCAVSIHLRT